MTKNIILAAMLLTGPHAFAMGSLDCSNANGTLTRDEQEIWGANKIIFTVNGHDVGREDDLEVSIDKVGPKKAPTETLQSRGRPTTAGVPKGKPAPSAAPLLDTTDKEGNRRIVYTAIMSISRKDGKSLLPNAELKSVSDFVICESNNNPHQID